MASTLPQYMKAAVFKSNPIEKNLAVRVVPLPKTARALKTDTVLVRVLYSSLNSIDYKVLESPAGYFLGGIPSVDFSGIVVDSKTHGIKIGDRVFGMTGIPAFGALADYVVAPKHSLAFAPQGVKLADLATLGVTGITAWQGIAPFVKTGDNILINGGSGGVGTFAIQIAKTLGCTVTAVCSAANTDLCKQLGADEVIDYKDDLVGHLRSRDVLYDHIFDTMFYNFELYWQAHHYLKKAGRFVTIGGNANLGFIRTMIAISLLPSWLGGGHREFRFLSGTANTSEYEKIAELLRTGKVKPVIEQVLPMEEAGQGYAKLKTRRARGKIVIKVNKE